MAGGTWWYNTESGQMAQNSGIGGFLQSIGGHLGLSAGWHLLSGNYSGCSAAAAAAAKQYPSGATPSCSGVSAGKVISGAAQDAKNAVNGGSPGSASTCVIKIPYLNACILSKTQARALIAGTIIGVSAVTVIVGLALITVDAMERTGAGKAAGKALETASAVAGPVGPAVRAVRSTGHAFTPAGGRERGQRAVARQRAKREGS